jgi:DNA invertase Pin-like site-specific DNA recombinase
MKKRVAIYLRVSTSKQDTDNQLRELTAVADRSGWEIWKVYEDAGISGAKGRDQRPGLDAMMKAVNAKEFDMVATWSVDRLGRSLTDLLSILQGLHDKGVGLFLHQQGLDTSTTAGKAMFQMLGVFAEWGCPAFLLKMAKRRCHWLGYAAFASFARTPLFDVFS